MLPRQDLSQGGESSSEVKPGSPWCSADTVYFNKNAYRSLHVVLSCL